MSNGSEFQVVLGKRVKVLYADCLEETCQECVFNANGCCADCPCAGNDKNGRYAYFVPAEDTEADLDAEVDREVQKLHTAPCYDELRNFAYHFVEWGAEHLKR